MLSFILAIPMIEVCFVFVHGTGVRPPASTHSLKLIQKGIEGVYGDQAAAISCEWGSSCGVRLPDQPQSIPTYDVTGGRAPSDLEVQAQLFAELFEDPLLELRSIAITNASISAMPTQVWQYSNNALRRLANRDWSREISKLLSSGEISEQELGDAATKLIDDDTTTAAGRADPSLAQTALPGALVAMIVAHSRSKGETSALECDPSLRNLWETQLSIELGQTGSLSASWLRRIKSDAAKYMLTRFLTENRGAHSDFASPSLGDIIMYQARGELVREVIVGSVNQAKQISNRVILLGHSLGGIAAVDLLICKDLEIAGIVTVGSQAPLLYELNALASLPYGEYLPKHFPRWHNIFDRRDFLSYLAASVFIDDRVSDCEVDNGRPFMDSHSAYWSNEQVFQAIKEWEGS